MCVYKPDQIRTGWNGIIDYVDIINDVRGRVMAILGLIGSADEAIHGLSTIKNSDLQNLISLCEDMLKEAWLASDNIYELFKRETTGGER